MSLFYKEIIMSKYSLNDDSGGFYNKLYRILIIIFMIILLLGLCLNSGGEKNYIPIMIISMAVTIALFFFVIRHERTSLHNNDNDAEYFGSLLESGEYFSSMQWQFLYRKYAEENKPHHLSALGTREDICFRYIKKVLRRDFYIPLLIFPLVGGTFANMIQEYAFPDSSFLMLMTCITAAFEIPYFAILYLSSLKFLQAWTNDHPRYKNSMKEINHSYITGDAYECAYFCVVIGPKYIHGFDGEKFHTVLRENVTACTWDIERLVIYATGKYGERYVGDEYRFSIKFQCKDSDIGSGFKITLDQFQIKLIMDRYFPKISSDENPAYNVTKAYGHRVSSIKKYASAPVI